MRTKRSSLLLFVTACTLLVTVNACETTSGGKTAANKEAARVTFDISQKPPDLQSGYQRLEEGGQQDAVLNWMRLGVAALQKGYLKEADQAFTEAIRGIERIYADSEQARKARSLWIEEGSKIFKGEPYERVMAYYYSGLVQILKGDYQNARARFKGGMLQDAFAEEEQFRCDFALMSYLAGWCSLQIPGDTLSGEWFEELRLLRPDAEVPSAEQNLLLVLETGTSPRKVSDGLGHYQLKFRRGRHFRDQQARFSVDGGPVQEAFLLEDVFWQASTRGGAPVRSYTGWKGILQKAICGSRCGSGRCRRRRHARFQFDGRRCFAGAGNRCGYRRHRSACTGQRHEGKGGSGYPLLGQSPRPGACGVSVPPARFAPTEADVFRRKRLRNFRTDLRVHG